MEYRLLVDLDVIRALEGISKSARSVILDHFIKLRSAPDRYSDYHEFDSKGRHIEISVFAGYSIHYRIDFSDRHVKVLALRPADQ